MTTRRTRIAVLALAVAVGGCITRSLPLPPPGQITQAVTECPSTECPDGGVVVRLNGQGLTGATVIAEDEDATLDPSGMLLAGAARVSATGTWQIILGPQRGSTGAIRAVQRGHTINIFQVNETGDASSTVSVTVR